MLLSQCRNHYFCMCVQVHVLSIILSLSCQYMYMVLFILRKHLADVKTDRNVKAADVVCFCETRLHRREDYGVSVVVR